MKTMPLRFISTVVLTALILGGLFPAGAAGISSVDTSGVGTTEQYQVLQPSLASAQTARSLPIAVDVKPGHSKLESVLSELVRAADEGWEGSLIPLANERGITLTEDSVTVVIETGPGAIDQVAIAAGTLGVKEEKRNANLLQVSAPVGALTAVADLPGVTFVRLPFIGYAPVDDHVGADRALHGRVNARQGAVVSEGVQVIGADVFQAAGIRGQGVTVAVLDLGFARFQNLLGNELPPTVVARSFRADGDITGGGEVHGTAVAEVVHDVAPDAALLLFNFSTDVEAANAIDFAVAQGAVIFSMSVGFFIGPFDGTGLLPEKITSVRNAGFFWANSAGNHAKKHWRGDFNDPNGNGLVEFAPGLELNSFTAPANSQMRVFLSWNDWPASAQDYNLFLFQQTPSGPVQVAASTNIQNGTQPPFESITFNSASGGTFGAVIQNAAATQNVFFQLFIDNFDLAIPVEATSILIPGDSPGSTTVAATLFSNDQLESFSSQGPTVDGRTKPDLAGPDGVSSVAFAPNKFFGTSAAAPHVAGAAALIQSIDPTLTGDEIESFLKQSAVDLGPPGDDNLFGAGRISLGSLSIVPGPPPGACPPDVPFFSETSFCVDNPNIQAYFQGRGGTDTFGFPASRTFRLLGLPAQVFQRHVLQVTPDGVRPLNLLDPDVLPVTTVNGATFPAHDPALAASAPPPSTPNFGEAVLAHLQANVPDSFEGENVQFLQAYLSAGQQAAQQGAFTPLVALEIWGFPTSRPARDPNNADFIYQRFQRGILHSFSGPGGRVTRGILLADNLKFVLTNDPVNLPGDLRGQVQGSRFFDQYCPNNPAWLCRPAELPDTDLTEAFETQRQ